MGVGINSVTSCNVYSSRVIGSRRMRKKEAEEGGGGGVGKLAVGGRREDKHCFGRMIAARRRRERGGANRERTNETDAWKVNPLMGNIFQHRNDLWKEKSHYSPAARPPARHGSLSFSHLVNYYR